MENLPESPFSDSALISSLCNISSSHADMQQNSHDLDGLTPNQLVLLLHDSNLRGEVMYQLIKKRDTCEDLAPLLWNTFNVVYMLLLEVISVYWKLSPPTLSMKESTRVCNALALFQVMAKNPETRKELIEAKIPCYFYPFLKPSGDDKPLEYLRLTSLGVLGALAKFDDPYGPKVLHFFLETEVVPSCLECIDLCDELSRKVATLIVMKILMQEKGMSYCCATPERFYSIVQVLYRVVQKLTEKPCLLHLMYVIQCFLSLSEVFKFIGPSEAFIRQVPPQLFDNTFKDILRDDHETAWMLQVLHSNVYGRLFPPE
ncbi:cell differentiation protein rcd1-like [Solanum stenotomum]|uniref:cell differentiation protein rcd1-like n=1 Tax=Solanum stenotomum TaxID=172797 RepID=UPI0020D145D2|nr:cell differentiation protein rcd1-like [Solanum stenotomum]